jgi:hypothetical protein
MLIRILNTILAAGVILAAVVLWRLCRGSRMVHYARWAAAALAGYEAAAFLYAISGTTVHSAAGLVSCHCPYGEFRAADHVTPKARVGLLDKGLRAREDGDRETSKKNALIATSA